MFMLNNAPFDIYSEHHIDGVNYPAGFFVDASTRAEIGIVEVADPAPPAPTMAEILAEGTGTIQHYMDSVAQAHGYDSMLSACSYLNSSVPKFAAEGAACLAWRDAVWTAAITIQTAIQAGTRSIPTADQLIAELPTITWPV